MVKKRNKDMAAEQYKRFCQFIFGSDMDFYEENIMSLSEMEQYQFFEDNPDFMSEYPVGRGTVELLKDKKFRKLLSKILIYEKRKNQPVG